MTTEPTPVAYVISAVEGVVDESTVKRYAELAGPAIEHFGGRFIASNTEPAVVEGESSSNYLSMVEFPSMDDAKAWYNSPEYAEARDLPPAAFRGRLLICGGRLDESDAWQHETERPYLGVSDSPGRW